MNEPNTELYGLPFVTDTFNSMPYLYLGKSGLRVSKIGLGTWKCGYPETGDGSRAGRKESFAIFDTAIEEGVTFWDTANRYNASSGNSERVIGEWLKSNPDMRRNVVIATKMYGLMDGKTPNHCRLSRLNIKESVYASLDRMGVDSIDLLYFHQFDPFTPLEESLGAVSDLVSQDMVRYLGVSNFSTEHLQAYLDLAGKGYPLVTAVQNKFNILQGTNESEKNVPDFCARNTLSYIPWGPLGQGLLTGRYLDKAAVGQGDRLYDEHALDAMLTDRNVSRLRKLDHLSREWGLSISQIALAYSLTLPGMGPMIPSAANPDQVRANAKAGKVELGTEQLSEIARALE